MSPMATVCIRGGGAAALPEWAAARESSSDEALIRRIAAGDQSAMRALFARYRVALYRWLLRLVDDEALAEDLLSEVFLDVWRRHAASFEARSSVSTWLFAIAHATRHSRRGAAGPTLNWTTNSRPRSRTLQTILSLCCRRRTGQRCYANPWHDSHWSTARSST
jgi:DNA-directed RNA polymerase specialized sigma24 family protein